MRPGRLILVLSLTVVGCGGNGTKPPRCGDGIVQSQEQCDDGNDRTGDGCEADCTTTPPPSMMTSGPAIIECPAASAQPLPSATCAITPGTTGAQLITGTILQPGRVLHGGQLLVDAHGVIACIDCDCSGQAAAAGASTLNCPTGVVSPGLINAHDHITYNHNLPAPDGGFRYEHRNEWRNGDGPDHPKIPYTSNNSRDTLSWNELRFVFGGATSTIGSGGTAGFLRNLDQYNNNGGLFWSPEVGNNTFPLSDGGKAIASGCTYSSMQALTEVAKTDAFQAHVSEGINDGARNEFVCLSGAAGGEMLTQPTTSFVHGAALTAADYQVMARTGTALVWSPRSNIALYGNTATVTAAARVGVQIALGTDWTLSGSANVLRELACADALNKTYFGSYFSDEDLWLMVTRNAAAGVNLEHQIGVLGYGELADIAIFDGRTHKDHRAVLAASPHDVVLVERAGKPLYGDAALVDGLAAGCDPVDVCGGAKSVCASSEVGKSYMALAEANAGTLDAFFCDATPPGEPTCTPKRPRAVDGSTVYDGTIKPDDSDGDGIANASDNCPTVFNPIRPLDHGAQTDGDGDGIGDACDPCPLDKAAMSCPKIDPFDVDGDGVPDFGDNCPNVANPDQADADSDAKGDLCDACPNGANIGYEACARTIVELRTKPELQNTLVGVKNALVTAIVYSGVGSKRKAGGFFIQMTPGDPGYVSPDNSGIFVFGTPPAEVQVGTRIDIKLAQLTTYFGEQELEYTTIVVPNPTAREADPAPVMVSAADVATGGPRAAALEGVLVRVADVNVTDIAPAPGPGDKTPTNEFVVDDKLLVDDLTAAVSPATLPAVGTNYASITGVLAFRNNNSKIGPRGAGDIVIGPPQLSTFGPALSYTHIGTVDQPTLPAATPLTIKLSGVVTADTVVGLTTPGSDIATVPTTVTVLAGTDSLVVPVTGIGRGTVEITATLGKIAKKASVRVLDDGTTDIVELASLTPPTGRVFGISGTTTLTVTLSLPAPAGGLDVALAAVSWMVPPTVHVDENALAATFTVTQAGGTASLMDTVTATLGASTAQSMLTVALYPMINEADYTIPHTTGMDPNEFVELYNPYELPIPLDGLTVVFTRVTGSGNITPYTYDVPLSGMLDPGNFIVIANQAAITNFTALPEWNPDKARGIVIAQADGWFVNATAGAVGIFDTQQLQVVSAFGWGKPLQSTIKNYTGTFNFGENTPATETMLSIDAHWTDTDPAKTKRNGSLIRFPDGKSTGNFKTDIQQTKTPTPGSANVFTPYP